MLKKRKKKYYSNIKIHILAEKKTQNKIKEIYKNISRL